MIKEGKYDVVIIGAGPSGMMAALGAAKSGAKVLICERRSLLQLQQNARYQAVVIDRQTVGNLRSVRVDESFLQHLTHCEFFGTGGCITGEVPFSELGSSKAKAGASLSKILFRRDVVALASINELEAKLREACQRESNIQLEYEVQTTSILERRDFVDLQVKFNNKQKRLSARLVGVADGANSDKRGGLALLNQKKKTLLRTGSIVTCRLKPQIKPGVIRILSQPGHLPAIGAAFALPKETVAYGTTSLKDASCLTPHQIRMLLEALGLDVHLNEEPNFIPQKVRIAKRFVVGKRCLVLGDAAFSGSAAMGSYLNKGVADGMAFGKVCRHLSNKGKLAGKVRKYASRRYSPAVEALIAEERTGKLIVATAEHPKAKYWENTFGHLLTRHIFRWKIRRKNLALTLCAIGLDNVSSTYVYLGKVADTVGIQPAGKIYRKLGKWTNKYLRYVT